MTYLCSLKKRLITVNQEGEKNLSTTGSQSTLVPIRCWITQKLHFLTLPKLLRTLRRHCNGGSIINWIQQSIDIIWCWWKYLGLQEKVGILFEICMSTFALKAVSSTDKNPTEDKQGKGRMAVPNRMNFRKSSKGGGGGGGHYQSKNICCTFWEL